MLSSSSQTTLCIQSRCSRLVQLAATNCEALEELPEGIGGGAALTGLELSGCGRLTELPIRIGDCAQLQRLDISKCRIFENDPG